MQKSDVIVIGAGFSGLSAAKYLTRHNKTITVLEARDRVGGRTKIGKIAGLTIDLGGMWVGPSQTELLALGDEYAVERYLQPLDGNNIIDLGGKVTKAPGEDYLSARSIEAKEQHLELLGLIEQYAEEMPVERFWEWSKAKALDHLSVSHWLDQMDASLEVKSDIAVSCRSLLCAEIHQVSFLHLIRYIKSGSGFTSLTTSRGGAQNWLFKGGVAQLTSKMADELPNGSLHLDCAVYKITHHSGGVTVGTSKGTFEARSVIVAIPPALAGRIEYAPSLSAQRDGLTQRLCMGSVIKCYLAFKNPFWREAGFNGLVLSDKSIFSPIFDVSPPDQPIGLLCGFIDGPAAVEWSKKEVAERKAQFISEAATWFGSEANSPLDYVDQDWNEEVWSRGCYGGYAAPGTWTTYGHALSEPNPPIYWAGAETSSQWLCYIDGAIRAGHRAAKQIINSTLKESHE